MNRTMDRRNRKFVFQLLGGAVAGAAVTFLALELAGDLVDAANGSQLAAVAVGVCYGLIGLLVIIGAIAPNLGAQMLNVEDAEELVELRRCLMPSALACVSIGTFLLALALTPANEDGRAISLVIAGGSIAGLIVFGAMLSRRVDEFSRTLGAEASALALYMLTALFAGWAALAHLRYVEWVDALTFVSVVAMLQLLATFIVVGKRGLIRPR